MICWLREDEIHAEQNRPKAAIELAKRDGSPEIIFRIFNLGGVIFFTEKMIVTFTGGSVQAESLVDTPVLDTGKFIDVIFDCSREVKDTFQEASTVFVLKAPCGEVRTDVQSQFGSISIEIMQVAMSGA